MFITQTQLQELLFNAVRDDGYNLWFTPKPDSGYVVEAFTETQSTLPSLQHLEEFIKSFSCIDGVALYRDNNQQWVISTLFTVSKRLLALYYSTITTVYAL